MINGEFKVDTEAGVVVFCQKAHGRNFVSVAKVKKGEPFNIGIGQLIAMKRNEIKIRKADIAEMREVVDVCDEMIDCFNGTGRRLFTNMKQSTSEKIAASLNHIRELNEDLDALYNGTYSELPESVKEGKEVYALLDGSVKLMANMY